MLIRNIFVDYDGVLAYFQKDKSIEEVAEPGYTLTVPMMDTVCDALTALMKDRDILATGISIRVLSAVLHDGAANDKKTMLERRFGKDFADSAMFVRYGSPKEALAEGNVLIDDFSYNLHKWEENGGVGIKMYNGINGTKGTWHGYSVHATSGSIIIYKTLKGIIMGLLEEAA